MTDIKQKAREVAEWFARKYMTPKRSPTYCIEDMAKKVAAAIQSAVAEEREENCKVVCKGCQQGLPVIETKVGETVAYWHEYGPITDSCKADAIRARGQKEKP